MDIRPAFTSLERPNDILELKRIISEMSDSLDILYSTTAPNGTISARQGRICLYNNAGTYQLWVNKDGASAWQRLADFDANAISIASPAQGDVIYYNGTSWVKLGAGTSGYFFKTQGTGANPLWAQLLGLPTSPAQGDIVYYNGSAWVSLSAGTSGQFLKTLGVGANPTWSAPPGFSNVIYSWSGSDNQSFNVGSSQSPTSGNIYAFFHVSGSNTAAYTTVIQFKWTKISSVSTLTSHVRSWYSQTDVTSYRVQVDVNAGGIAGDTGSITNTSPAWQTGFTLDVSGLTNGVTYDILIKLGSPDDSTGTRNIYLSAVTILGS